MMKRKSKSKQPSRCYRRCRGYGRLHSEEREEEEASSESGLDGAKTENYELQVMTRTYRSRALAPLETDSDR